MCEKPPSIVDTFHVELNFPLTSGVRAFLERIGSACADATAELRPYARRLDTPSVLYIAYIGLTRIQTMVSDILEFDTATNVANLTGESAKSLDEGA